MECDDVSSEEGIYNVMHDKSVYEFECPDGTMEQRIANIAQGTIWFNQFSQMQHPQSVGSKGHKFLCTWVHLCTSHATGVVAKVGFGVTCVI